MNASGITVKIPLVFMYVYIYVCNAFSPGGLAGVQDDVLTSYIDAAPVLLASPYYMYALLKLWSILLVKLPFNRAVIRADRGCCIRLILRF